MCPGIATDRYPSSTKLPPSYTHFVYIYTAVRSLAGHVLTIQTQTDSRTQTIKRHIPRADYISEQFRALGHHLEEENWRIKRYIERYEEGEKHWGRSQTFIIRFRRSGVAISECRLTLILYCLLFRNRAKANNPNTINQL